MGIDAKENVIEHSGEVTQKAKQKASLGIRPSDSIEDEFKSLCKVYGKTQTQMFEDVFEVYLESEKQTLLKRGFDCNADILMLEDGYKNLIGAITSIVSKVQSTVMKKDSEIDEIRYDMESRVTDKVNECKRFEEELLDENKRFQCMVEEYESRIMTLQQEMENYKVSVDDLNKKSVELELEVACKETHITELDGNLRQANAKIKSNREEMVELSDKYENVLAKNRSLQASVDSMQKTVETINLIKDAEIKAIKSNAISMLELEVSKVTASKDIEILELRRLVNK